MQIAAVLFDLDGTLVDSERVNVESVVLAVRRWGKTLDDHDRHFIVGHSWNEIHRTLCDKHSIAVPLAEMIAAAVDEKRALVAKTGIPALPGAVAAVRRLALKAPLAVVSGASKVEVDEAVDSLGLRDAFAFLMGAEDYSRGKPDPMPYSMAIERLGVDPKRTLVIEDAEPGVRSGLAAGARVVGVQVGNFSGYDLSAAHAVIPTLDHLDDAFLARLFQS